MKRYDIEVTFVHLIEDIEAENIEEAQDMATAMAIDDVGFDHSETTVVCEYDAE